MWSYKASTLYLMSDPFSTMQKAAYYFNVNYKSILNHLDTKLATYEKYPPTVVPGIGIFI